MGLLDALVNPCGLKGNIQDPQCEPSSEGIDDLALIIQRSDVLGYTVVTPTIGGVLKDEKPSIFNAIDLKFTKHFWLLSGRNKDKRGGGGFENSKFTHSLAFRAKQSNHDTTSAVQKLCRVAGGAVAIVQTKNSGDEFRVLGRQGGLEVQTASNMFEVAENLGGFDVSAVADAKGFAEFLAVYTGTAPNQVYSYEQSLALFNSLVLPQFFDIANIVVGGVNTTITLDDTLKKPYVQEVKVGTSVSFQNIVGTVGTDLTNGLNNKTFVISEIVDEKTFKITANTTGLVYTSGGEVR